MKQEWASALIIAYVVTGRSSKIRGGGERICGAICANCRRHSEPVGICSRLRRTHAMARERNRASSSSLSSASSSSSSTPSTADSGTTNSPGDERSPVELLGLPGVCGQSAVTRALTDALHAGRLHHAYLFDGPEGTGKATCARALFAALNCQEPPAVGAAWGSCESCYKLSHGAHPDPIPFDMSLSGWLTRSSV